MKRRQFLQQAAALGGALTVGFYLGPARAELPEAEGTAGSGVLQPNAFVRIGTDSSVTVIAGYLEMGQGVFTGLATLLAEELDADWRAVLVEGAPADVKHYVNAAIGMQGTLGSTAMASSFQPMRAAGATARALLVAAAAQQWNVSADGITVDAGVVSHMASGRRTPFGALTALAATLPVPTTVKLKDPAQFRLIGSPWVRRKDTHAKTNGSALYTQDLKLPEMLVAVAAHPRRFGASVRGFDATATRAIPGVVEVVAFAGDAHRASGIAVLAQNTWTAQRGRDALQIEWDESGADHSDSEQLLARYRGLAQSPGTAVRSVGDMTALTAADTQRLQVSYEVPWLAHAAMEPMNCLVQLTEAGVSLWNAEQLQTADQAAVAQLLGLKAEQVQITQLYAGGSFGRRANPHADYLLEAVAIAKSAAAAGHRVPIKLVWTREDDMHAGYYRPGYVHSITAALDLQGRLVAWQQRTVGQSIVQDSPFQSRIHDGVDESSVEGSAEPYEIPNVRIELTTPSDVGVPVQWWCSAGHSHTAFATECTIDELAALSGQDPYLFRRRLLGSHPRALAVLDLAATRARWGTTLTVDPDGARRGRGIALHEYAGTSVAQVAEVRVAIDGTLTVERVICAVDCGTPINPNVITALMEGGIGHGLAAAMHGAITFKDGLIGQSDFDDYRTLHMGDMPAVEVYIVPSHAPPSGAEDAGSPPIAPALVNAIYDATGQRIRRLPVADQLKAALAGKAATPSTAEPAAAAAAAIAPAGGT